MNARSPMIKLPATRDAGQETSADRGGSPGSLAMRAWRAMAIRSRAVKPRDGKVSARPAGTGDGAVGGSADAARMGHSRFSRPAFRTVPFATPAPPLDHRRSRVGGLDGMGKQIRGKGPDGPRR